MIKAISLTKSDFLQKVSNYEAHPEEWIFEGKKPCIVDFYAEWYAPSKKVSAILEEIAVEYAGQINIYKVNTEKEEDLTSALGIRSIPSLLFCPVDKRPQMARGTMSKLEFKKAIKEVLL
ncbi:thioredoxin [Parabacteroides sp. PF5-5]|uniref:thioredoxin domain-containing protein n=1 Tax=unclassified Parabacteroides TaxID=2649774 RepID=UPI002476D959|nr:MULTISPECIES: thioredoxin domain-containing protein [unclassified Parabacteroides]MDH6304075.1 thioredoxin [Parabacteroides sp. PH5-39]MDH6315225.1 thioredoxin [Parabacteroides sp. PF5-13]MDH6318870.1 thioredoxin [Parabacteroides sp. PH5-13]MDH6322599.1 thioredoxin [Parabacteroides sp. PH5-8]MDH6326249.1 thioredoxin [Parabacteroides sp. PH5-41]